MSTTSFVTNELDKMRAGRPTSLLTDNQCWDLCRMALGDRAGHMPKDEIVRRVASLVDMLVEFRVKQLEGKRIESYLTDDPGDTISLTLCVELHNVPMADTAQMKSDLESGGSELLAAIKASYVPA